MSHDPQQPQSGNPYSGPPGGGQPYGQGQQPPAQPYGQNQPYGQAPYGTSGYPAQSYQPPSAPKKPRPSAWWWLGPALLLVGALVSVIVAVSLIADTVNLPRTEVPVDGSEYEVTTTDGVSYLVWSDAAVSFLQCTVTDADGSAITLRSPSGEFTVNEWDAVGQFTARGEKALVTCQDDAAVTASAVRVSESPEASGVVASVLLLIVVPLVLGGIAFVWGIVLLILTVSRPSRRASQQA
ncbi:MAG: hypothetical protein ACI379_01810 [Nocardioides sp.]|uniref:hypothetical protein n=1 Tax=Nocardioides sp. TaxID=35761 RepID=UPI003F07B8C0